MNDLEQKLNDVLSNPQMMQQIMSLAQNLSPADTSAPPAAAPEPPALQGIDLSMIQKLSGLTGQSNIDKNQRMLLQSLTPYLSQQRISKLEKAMRAAKMANLATGVLGGKLSGQSR